MKAKSLLERFEDEKNRKSRRSNFIETYEISKKNEELIEKIKESKLQEKGNYVLLK